MRNEDVGRHVIASRDIRAGELVAVEDPVSYTRDGSSQTLLNLSSRSFMSDSISSPSLPIFLHKLHQN